MAKKRDVIIGVIIAVSFVFAFVFFGLLVIGFLSPDSDFEFAGLGGNVGVVEMFGVIDEESGRPVIKLLDKWGENNSIKAVVVHINSPGGGVAISQELFDAIRRVKENKPVVAAMASVAASGGYYIACAADRIIANPGTVTGSIGVIFQFHTLQGLMDKIGVGTETVKSGDLKDVGTYSRSMTNEESLMLRSVVMDSYEQFVEVVSEGRDMERDEVYLLADGSLFTGLQAYNHGLIDTLGGLKEAVDLAADLAGLEGEPSVVRPRERKQLTIFDLVQGVLGQAGRAAKDELVGPELMFLYR
ncbi:MAG: signal peptide peptidase SppA [candidate division Zixibacteria bacterium]|nr:signal peptide peptidase SppA [candidate division Zixibacteria bacterium]